MPICTHSHPIPSRTIARILPAKRRMHARAAEEEQEGKTHKQKKKQKLRAAQFFPVLLENAETPAHQSAEFNMENVQTGNCAAARVVMRSGRRCSTKQCINFLPSPGNQPRALVRAHHHQKCKCNMHGNNTWHSSTVVCVVCCVF